MALFWREESIGVAFEDRFRPLPLPAVAFVLTAMQHGIEELFTGRFVKIELNVEQQRKAYESHLLGLLEYDKKALGRLLTFQENWFKNGMQVFLHFYRLYIRFLWTCRHRIYSGANFTPEVAPYQAITRADQIREDTPVHDVVRQAVVTAKGRASY